MAGLEQQNVLIESYESFGRLLSHTIYGPRLVPMHLVFERMSSTTGPLLNNHHACLKLPLY